MARLARMALRERWSSWIHSISSHTLFVSPSSGHQNYLIEGVSGT
jgi:hypothetical protein